LCCFVLGVKNPISGRKVRERPFFFHIQTTWVQLLRTKTKEIYKRKCRVFQATISQEIRSYYLCLRRSATESDTTPNSKRGVRDINWDFGRTRMEFAYNMMLSLSYGELPRFEQTPARSSGAPGSSWRREAAANIAIRTPRPRVDERGEGPPAAGGRGSQDLTTGHDDDLRLQKTSTRLPPRGYNRPCSCSQKGAHGHERTTGRTTTMALCAQMK
jgi:hypothetical protein